MRRHFPRVLVGLIAFAVLLAVAARVARGDGVAWETSPGSPAVEAAVEPVNDVTLVTLLLVGGTALLAGSAWLNQMQRLLP